MKQQTAVSTAKKNGPGAVRLLDLLHYQILLMAQVGLGRKVKGLRRNLDRRVQEGGVEMDDVVRYQVLSFGQKDVRREASELRRRLVGQIRAGAVIDGGAIASELLAETGLLN